LGKRYYIDYLRLIGLTAPSPGGGGFDRGYLHWGASDHFDFSRFGKYLLSVRKNFVVYDNDQAGELGSKYWLELSERVKQVRIPQSKDVTEYWKTGGNLNTWVRDILSPPSGG